MMEGRGDVKGRTLCYDMTLTVEQFKFFQSYVDRFRGIMLFNNIGYRWGSDVCDLSLCTSARRTARVHLRGITYDCPAIALDFDMFFPVVEVK